VQIQPIGGSGPQVSAVAGATPMSTTSPPPTPHLDGTLDGIAQALSMDPSQLKSALSGGQSITDLAQQQGVNRNDLLKSVETTIQNTRQANGQQPLDQTQLDRMVNRAFDRHRTGGHHHAHAHAQAATTATDATTVTTNTTSTSTTSGIDTYA